MFFEDEAIMKREFMKLHQYKDLQIYVLLI
jgi:hypothetical protein